MTDPRAFGADDAPTGGAVSLRWVVRPDWLAAAEPRRWPRGLLRIWLFGLVGAAIAFVFLRIAVDAAGFESVLEDELDELSGVAQLFLVAVLAPTLEEAIYRLPLMARLHLPLIAVSGVLAGLFFAAFAVPGFVVAAVALGAHFIEPVRTRLEGWGAENPAWPIWLFSVVFALTHLVNYEVDWTIGAVLAAPFVVGPQLWLGLMFALARVRYGWWAAVLVHAFHNLSIWTLASTA